MFDPVEDLHKGTIEALNSLDLSDRAIGRLIVEASGCGSAENKRKWLGTLRRGFAEPIALWVWALHTIGYEVRIVKKGDFDE